MTRALPEWIGRTDDSQIPSRVRLRVFEAYGGRCHLSGKKIMHGDAWDIDHKTALCNGGEHRESNLAPVLKDKHREKTREDIAIKTKTDRMRAKHLGIYPPAKHKLKGRGFERRWREG